MRSREHEAYLSALDDVDDILTGNRVDAVWQNRLSTQNAISLTKPWVLHLASAPPGRPIACTLLAATRRLDKDDLARGLT